MGYGKKGWFLTYFTMMQNSFKYAANSGTAGEKWFTRGLALIFSLVWFVFTIFVFIGLPVLGIYTLYLWIISL